MTQRNRCSVIWRDELKPLRVRDTSPETPATPPAIQESRLLTRARRDLPNPGNADASLRAPV